MLTEQEFHQAAERYLDMTYRVALNWFRRPADAEDAVQETICGCGGRIRTSPMRSICAAGSCG